MLRWIRQQFQSSHHPSQAEQLVLRRLVRGWSLKSHRDIEGRKLYRLHSSTGDSEPVSTSTVRRLRRRGLIAGNHKFPSATYLLTDAGQSQANQLDNEPLHPVSTKNWRG